MNTTYWINAKTNPPKNNQKIIGLSRNGMIHKMIFVDEAYLFDCEYPYGAKPYAANPIIYPEWWIPAPMFKEEDSNE